MIPLSRLSSAQTAPSQDIWLPFDSSYLDLCQTDGSNLKSNKKLISESTLSHNRVSGRESKSKCWFEKSNDSGGSLFDAFNLLSIRASHWTGRRRVSENSNFKSKKNLGKENLHEKERCHRCSEPESFWFKWKVSIGNLWLIRWRLFKRFKGLFRMFEFNWVKLCNLLTKTIFESKISRCSNTIGPIALQFIPQLSVINRTSWKRKVDLSRRAHLPKKQGQYRRADRFRENRCKCVESNDFILFPARDSQKRFSGQTSFSVQRCRNHFTTKCLSKFMLIWSRKRFCSSLIHFCSSKLIWSNFKAIFLFHCLFRLLRVYFAEIFWSTLIHILIGHRGSDGEDVGSFDAL